ncbi:MAG: hypothetical protein IV089_13245 [Thiobacillus sp.]|nr:hypothetical protein [Thiobacillus sp.]
MRLSSIVGIALSALILLGSTLAGAATSIARLVKLQNDGYAYIGRF